MSDKPVDYLVETSYGFNWGGVMDVERINATEWRKGEGLSRVVGITTPHHKTDIYVSPTGRSVRVYRDGKELK